MKLKVEVSAYGQTVTVDAFPGSHAEKLYKKWYASQNAADWMELLDWITPDVAEDMEIEITDVSRH